MGLVYAISHMVLMLFFCSAAWAQVPQGPGRPMTQNQNPDISLDGLFAAGYFSDPNHLNLGGHDPKQRGFTLENLELTLGATVDPYARADAHIVYLIDEGGKSAVEVEEAFLTTLALPSRLQLIAGQFVTRFGRLNPTHPHTWDFADQPVINNRLFGPDGLRNPGVQLSWLAPLPWYLELVGSVQNAGGETAVSFLSVPTQQDGTVTVLAGHPLLTRGVERLEDLLYMGRMKSAWSPTETVEVVTGVSGLSGPNASGVATRTGIYGADFYSKWRPLSADHGFPFVAFQAEGLWRRYEAGAAMVNSGFLPGETLQDGGAYAQGLWGFIRRWVAGFRVEYANGGRADDLLRDRRWRLSPDLTFYPSEFSKWRLQYNADLSQRLGDATLHAVFLQFEFLIGTHGAHQF